MPLTFESLSHGTIAFGFFNIESDMLLCDNYFFFADDFCARMVDLTVNVGDAFYQAAWDVRIIEKAEDIGDLTGAIHGVRFSGFIGGLYRRFPFPRRPEDFKQNPDGVQTQAVVSAEIAKYARPLKITIEADRNNMEIGLGAYRFNPLQFHELLKYVWRGGYPRWKNEIRPDYVLTMQKEITRNPGWVFGGIEFNG